MLLSKRALNRWFYLSDRATFLDVLEPPVVGGGD